MLCYLCTRLPRNAPCLLRIGPLPKQFIGSPNARRYLVQFLARWFDFPIRMNRERVSLKTGKDMHMDMKYLLKCRFPISKKEIDAFTLHSRMSEGFGHLQRDGKQMRSDLFIQVREKREMLFRNHQHMSRVDRANREIGADHLVFIDDTGWSFSCDDVAEDAGFPAFHLFLLCTHTLPLAFLRKLVRQLWRWPGRDSARRVCHRGSRRASSPC